MGLLVLGCILLTYVASGMLGDSLDPGIGRVHAPGLFSWLNPRNYIDFYLWTRNNRDNPQRLYIGNQEQLASSYFQPNMSTKVLIHGFGEDTWRSNLHWASMRQELLSSGPYNVIGVSWEYLALPYSYVFAAANTELVGQQLAKLLDFLHDSTGVTLESLHLIGFSLGAHVAGWAGQLVSRGRIGRITGLDPAGPGFHFVGDDQRLSADDAIMVDAIHTSGATNLYRGFGLIEPVGHADFYINGGKLQPGCSPEEADLIGIICNHKRAAFLYNESINSETPFLACKCSSLEELLVREQCSCPSFAIVGERLSSKAKGIYYVSTNSRYPFVKKLPVSNQILNEVLLS